MEKSGLLEQILGARGRISQKDKYRREFVDVMNLNLKLVNSLVLEAKKLKKKGEAAESDRLFKIAQEVLNSNGKLQSTVVDVLSKID